MKKVFVLLLTIVMLCSLFTACGNKKVVTYADLTYFDLGMEREYFGIAFRTGSDVTRMVEDITLELIDSGKLAELSTTYEVGAVGKGDYTPAADPCTGSGDYDYVKANGKLVIGITDYKPMDYKDENGEWIGFDADYARAVCAKR